MKQQIKALTDKFVRLEWRKNGGTHSFTGVIKHPKIVQFTFVVNKEHRHKVRFENVKNVELIK